MINSITISGNCTKDAEQVVTKNGNPLAKFTVAVDRYTTTSTGEYKKATSFISCVMYGHRSEKVAPMLTKGTKVVVQGQLEDDRWENAEGEKRCKTFVKAFNVEVMTPQKDTYTDAIDTF